MQYPSTEELNRMTLQVGLDGENGLVITSDRLLQQFEGGGKSIDRRFSKFFSAPGLTCCWSGDTIAEHTANSIRRVWMEHPFAKSAVQNELQHAGDISWAEHEALAERRGHPLNLGVTRKVIVACHDELWLLEVCRPRSLAHSRSRVVAGDAENTACHFINKYGTDPNLPVSRLITLAAYAVIVAGDENPTGISGLEIAVIPKGAEVFFLTAEQEKALEGRCRAIAENIGEQLLRPFEITGVLE